MLSGYSGSGCSDCCSGSGCCSGYGSGSGCYSGYGSGYSCCVPPKFSFCAVMPLQ